MIASFFSEFRLRKESLLMSNESVDGSPNPMTPSPIRGVRIHILLVYNDNYNGSLGPPLDSLMAVYLFATTSSIIQRSMVFVDKCVSAFNQACRVTKYACVMQEW